MEASISTTSSFPMLLRCFHLTCCSPGQSPEAQGCEQSTAFRNSKQALSDATLLVHQNVKAATAVTCEASGRAIGSCLDQLIDGEWKPLAFFSKKLSLAELKHSAFDRELLAI